MSVNNMLEYRFGLEGKDLIYSVQCDDELVLPLSFLESSVLEPLGGASQGRLQSAVISHGVFHLAPS